MPDTEGWTWIGTESAGCFVQKTINEHEGTVKEVIQAGYEWPDKRLYIQYIHSLSSRKIFT